MIERAELQSKAANAIYIKLRKEHDSTIGMVESLKRELKSVETKLEIVGNEKEDSLYDFEVDIAELETANARLESDAAQRAKGYRLELEGQLKATKGFERRLEDAESISRSLYRLQQECDEMKNVCEEFG